ncbi:hypothetical protein UACE39S_04175 [Ureibacillus acetophenoni]
MKLSVVTTIYNGQLFIDSMFESVFKQTFQNFEWIIVDDGSTDSTWEKLQNYKDNRIRLFRLPQNKGVGFANQFALTFVNGQYLAKVDVDDISYPYRFEKQINYLDENASIDLIDSFIEYFPHNQSVELSERYQNLRKSFQTKINREISSEDLTEEILWDCYIINGAMMARSEKIKSIGYDVSATQGEDYLLYYNMLKANMRFARLPEKLVNIRVSDFSTTALNEHLIQNIILQVKKNDLENFVLDSSRPLAIWGAGQCGIDTYHFLRERYNVIPKKFFDSNENKNGKKLFGIEISKPHNFKKYKICIASSYGREDIVKKLKSQGCFPLKDYYIIF